MNKLAKLTLALTLAATMAGLSGCAATHVAVAKRELDVQTKMSATVFLDPVKAADRTIVVQIRNTSDKPDFDIQNEIASALQGKGYRVVDDPDQARFILQANILQVGKTDKTAAERAFGSGYGGVLDGAAAGMMAGYAGGIRGGGMAGAGLIGALAGTVLDAAVKDVYFSVITDVQIQERMRKGKKAQIDSAHRLKQGTSGDTSVTYQDDSDFRAYQTRILSMANKVNLEFEEAQPALKTGLTRSISGVF